MLLSGLLSRSDKGEKANPLASVPGDTSPSWPPQAPDTQVVHSEYAPQIHKFQKKVFKATEINGEEVDSFTAENN